MSEVKSRHKKRKEKKRNRETILPWHTKSTSGLKENGLQMLLPKPEEEMFTIWCTLYAKLVPAGQPRILVKHLGRRSTVKKTPHTNIKQ